jgi:hypothetical protein
MTKHLTVARQDFCIYRGGFCNRLRYKVTVNRDLIETVLLTASVHPLIVADDIRQPPRLIHINRRVVLCRPSWLNI